MPSTETRWPAPTSGWHKCRAVEREAQRPVCTRCRQKFTDERWAEITARGCAWTAGDLTVCGTCHADDVAGTTTGSRPGPAALFRRRG
ncbi:hypothetical protein ACIBG6_04990 [Streptomyces sp. NPDC050842]|uniref:hypothetical protein n=1 Tax=Streptomyces sp. NPDC050842 TaxID=3365636 RepID=UPI0037AC022A